MYEEIIAIVGYAIDHWGAYDSWCLVHGFDPLEIPSRRMVNSVWAWMIEGMEPEQYEKLIQALNTDTYESSKIRVARRLRSANPPEPTETGKPTEKFRAPKGWKPAWYNEEKAYKASQGFMKAQRTGFKTGGE